MLVLGIMSWSINNWALEKRHALLVGGGYLLVSAFLVVIAVANELTVFGIVSGGVIVSVGLVMIVVFRWASNDFLLPPVWRIVISVIVTLLTIGGIALLIAFRASWFSILTVVLGFLALFLSASAIQLNRQTTDSKLVTSLHYFPIFRYSKSTLLTSSSTGISSQCFTSANASALVLFALALILCSWGFLAGVLFSAEDSWVGWLAFSGGVSCGLLTLFNQYLGHLSQFWIAFDSIRHNAAAIDDCRRKAINVRLSSFDSL